MFSDLAFAVRHQLRRRTFDVTRVPSDPREHAVLASIHEWQASREEARRLGLPLHPDPPKTWDTLLALGAILRHVPRDGRVLDAGGELYSTLLPSLSLYGYQRLVANNLVFAGTRRRANITYVPGDLTATPWTDGSFAGIACLSVVEHGVDPGALFRECGRLLQPGGIAVISTDYWPTPVDTAGQVAYGTPIRIFTRADLAHWVELAAAYGLEPATPLDAALTVTPSAPAVEWRRFGLRYTFALVTFRKRR